VSELTFPLHRTSDKPGRQASRGFTLLEILVVMVLIAIVVSLASVRFQRDDRQVLRDEALRLASLLTHARDEAITTGVALGWSADQSGYRFSRRGANREWGELASDDILRPRLLPAPIQLIGIDVADQGVFARSKATARPTATPDVVFMPSAANRPFRLVLELNGTRMQVRVDQSDEIIVEDARS
jgi:general secretion pathway protein H